MGCQAQNEAFHGLPGHWVKPFYKPFKMDLTLTNHRFNHNKFKYDCWEFDGSIRITWWRSSWHTGRITRGFREYTWLPSLAFIAYHKVMNSSFFRTKEPPSDILSCAQWVPMFELCFCNRLSLVPLNWVVMLCSLWWIHLCLNKKPPSFFMCGL